MMSTSKRCCFLEPGLLLRPAVPAAPNRNARKSGRLAVPSMSYTPGKDIRAVRESLALISAATERLSLRLRAVKRGKLASAAQRREVESLVETLVASAADTDKSLSAPVTGTFRLVYASTREPFRSSIFFWAFKQALSFSRSAETAVSGVFRVTGSLPGVSARAIVHVISESAIRSIVDLDIFPGFRGNVVSEGSLDLPLVYDGGSDEQSVRVETTRVVDSNYLPVSASWVAPVGRILDAVGGDGRDGATARFRVVFGDEEGHVIRVGPGSAGGTEDLFVYEPV